MTGGKLLESELAAAAQRVSSAPSQLSRGSDGQQSKEVEWDVLRGRVARAIVADPDVVVYFAYLASNRACALSQVASAQLSEMVVCVEGWKYEQLDAVSPTTLQGVLKGLAARTTVAQEDVTRLATTAEAYVTHELIPKISRGSRLQRRGAAAITAYGNSRDELSATWTALRQVMATIAADRTLSADTLRNASVGTAITALSVTSALLDQARLVEFAVQLAAASAAVRATGKQVDLSVRFRTGADPFPDNTTTTGVWTDGLLTALYPSESPLSLGVRSGDTVTAPSGTAVVQTVNETGLTLSDSTITSLIAGVVVTSTAYAQWETLQAAIRVLYVVLPSAADLLSEVKRKEDQSAARIRALMEYLYRTAVLIGTPSADAVAALGRVGGAAYVYAGLSLEVLTREFAPLFRSKTKQAGDRVLTDLEGAGFDYAVELLYAGQVDRLLEATAGQLSRKGKLAEAATALKLSTVQEA